MKTLITLKGIHKSYAGRVILDDAGATFSEKQKIGVIGRNGAGKSTLCKIITGHEEADEGEVAKSRDLRLSYLEQHDPYKLDETVCEFLMRYTGKEEWQCGMMADRFHLTYEHLQAMIGSLPGGYRTRVKLTSMLLSEPNFLILDEPTNYLDLKTLILLENFFREFDGGFLIVSHDREFLKRTCEETLEIENGGCTLYPGNVHDYLIFKEEQKRQAESYNKTIEAKQKQLQQFVDRFKAKASKATQARSKMKQIARLEKIEVGHQLANVHIKIPQVERRNGVALRVNELSIGYPDRTVATKIHLDVDHGRHVAIVGDNGQGKTTFLRTIAEDLQPLGGEYKWGMGIRLGYYAQHVFAALAGKDDVFSYLEEKADKGISRQDILNVAGSFLFKGDDVKKKVSVLSGGERARLCLAGLLLSKCNVLLLDEPTNHLDFETVEALGRALKNFHGTLFFVSHDRTFVNLLATEIIEVGGGEVLKYPGTYEEYVYHIEQRVEEEERGEPKPAKEKKAKAEEPKPAATIPSADKKSPFLRKKELESELRKLKTQLKKLEEQLAAQKKEHQQIHDLFVHDSAAWTTEKNARYEELTRLIAADEQTWLTLTEKANSLAAQIEKLK